MKKSKRAFTLLELMAAVIILSILAAVAMASYQGYRDRAAMLVDETNLKVLAAAIKLYAYDNNSLPGSLSQLRPEHLERAYAQVIGATRPAAAFAFLREWMGGKAAEAHDTGGAAHTHPHPPLDRRYLGANPLRILTCPVDESPPRLENGVIVDLSYTIPPDTAGQLLSFLLNPDNAGLPLVYEAEDVGAERVFRHRNKTLSVGISVGGNTHRRKKG